MQLFVRKDTGLLCEAQLFDNFALIRPLDPVLCRDIRKMKLSQFGDEYEEYGGDQDEVYSYLKGETELPIIGSKKIHRVHHRS